MSNSECDGDEIEARVKTIQKLLMDEARLKGGFQDRQRITNRYALERFLFRLSKSSHADQFVLKGAVLLVIYVPEANRPSKDADFQLRGVSTPEEIRDILIGICSINCDDGLTLNVEGITVRSAGKDREYPGYTAIIPARLGAMNCPIHLDFGFGEAITPSAVFVEYPTMLSLPRPRLKVYPVSTVIAEKFEALVSLSMSNSRMKDFYDLSRIADCCDLEGAVLQTAVIATFSRRSTALPSSIPAALTPKFYGDASKIKQWKAFMKSSSLKGGTLRQVCEKIEAMMMPVTRAATASQPWCRKWDRGAWSED